MRELLVLLCLHCLYAKVLYSDSYIAFYDGRVNERNFEKLQKFGYVFDRQLKIGPGYYRFLWNATTTRSIPQKFIDKEELQRSDPQLVSFEQERLWFREKKGRVPTRTRRAVTVSDQWWSHQWHLAPGHSPSMGVYNAWDAGYTGQGVTVAIVDDGIDVTHTDLVGNYNASLSINILTNSSDPSHVRLNEGHGTSCAGIVAAVKNTECVIGVAYHASIPAIRLLDTYDGATSSEEAMALIHEVDKIDIYSNSWGPPDTGAGYDSALGSVQQAALIQGVTYGRGGKGTIYTWAAGNGGDYYDDCNVDGYANSMYTVAVTSLAPDSSPAWYSEQCTSVMVATFGGDDTQDQIATTERYNGCTDEFQGTSAAAPVASGIIALVLQANPDLTWRDIQHMIVEHSTNTGLRNASFYTNGAGKRVSLTHGFGLMNAEAMVTSAPSWKTVPERFICEGSTSSVYLNRYGTGTISSTFRIQDCYIGYLENVLVTIYFQSKYREYTSIYLVSPSGTDSRILRERYYDFSTASVTWTFMSVHTWGENSHGTWTLRMKSTDYRNYMNLYTWKLTFYGTVSDPLAGIPNDGEDGGHCENSVPCNGTNSICLSAWSVCVPCKSGRHAINGSCVEDGSLGGYCDGMTTCIDSTHGCNLTTNRCACNNGYHAIGGSCIRDGSLGGFCDGMTTCINFNHGCNLTVNRCQICNSGYHTIGGSCIRDGSLGGYCDGITTCVTSTHGCNLTMNRCVTCDNGYQVIGGLCIQDGTFGGFCNENITCINSDLHCEDATCIPVTDEASVTDNNIGRTVGIAVGSIVGFAIILGVGIVVKVMSVKAKASVAPIG